MKIIIGCDFVGLELKDAVKEFLISEGHDVLDIGVNDSEDKKFYADVAKELAMKVSSKEYDRGMLFCGTGIGVAIAANKVKGAYATVCHDPFSAQRASLSNDANIITMGYRVIGKELAKVVAKNWLDVSFIKGCASQSNVDAVLAVEDENFK